jgi:hypothetical protein
MRFSDPKKGPQTPGWKKYDPKDPTSLALFGASLTKTLPGNHTETDAVCKYWNTLLPHFPQVSVVNMSNAYCSHKGALASDVPCLRQLDMLELSLDIARATMDSPTL